MFIDVRKNFIPFLILFCITMISILIATAISSYIQLKTSQKTQVFEYFIVAECEGGKVMNTFITGPMIDDIDDIRIIESNLTQKMHCEALVVDFKLFRNQDEK